MLQSKPFKPSSHSHLDRPQQNRRKKRSNGLKRLSPELEVVNLDSVLQLALPQGLVKPLAKCNIVLALSTLNKLFNLPSARPRGFIRLLLLLHHRLLLLLFRGLTGWPPSGHGARDSRTGHVAHGRSHSDSSRRGGHLLEHGRLLRLSHSRRGGSRRRCGRRDVRRRRGSSGRRRGRRRGSGLHPRGRTRSSTTRHFYISCCCCCWGN